MGKAKYGEEELREHLLSYINTYYDVLHRDIDAVAEEIVRDAKKLFEQHPYIPKVYYVIRPVSRSGELHKVCIFVTAYREMDGAKFSVYRYSCSDAANRRSLPRKVFVMKKDGWEVT